MNLDSGACRVLELQQAVSFVLQLVHLRLVGQQAVGLENLMEVQESCFSSTNMAWWWHVQDVILGEAQ